jgi:hypothetical protein
VPANIQKQVGNSDIKKRPEQAFWRKYFSFNAHSGRYLLFLKISH